MPEHRHDALSAERARDRQRAAAYARYQADLDELDRGDLARASVEAEFRRRVQAVERAAQEEAEAETRAERRAWERAQGEWERNQ